MTLSANTDQAPTQTHLHLPPAVGSTGACVQYTKSQCTPKPTAAAKLTVITDDNIQIKAKKI